MNKKRGTWARLMALCLTLLLAVGTLGTTAWADSIVKDTGSITVSNVEDGVTVSAYQVMTVNFDYTSQQPVDPVYSWSKEVKGWVGETYPAYINEDGSVAEAFTEATAEDVAGFYDKLAAAIKGKTIILAASGTCTGNGTIGDLPMGGYLILVENGMKVYRPSAVNIVPKYDETNGWTMSTSELKVKASEPTIDKTVNEDENAEYKDKSDKGAIGDTVSFDLRADVPQYPANAIAKGYAISDTLSKGLTLTEGSIKVYGVKGDTETLLTTGTEYTQSTTRPNNKGTSSFTLTFTYDTIKEYEKIHVEYDAVINADAVVGGDGNPNKATLDYNNNPYDNTSWEEKTDKVTVYTYGLKVNKVNNNNELLTGAEFTLSKNKDGSDPLEFFEIGDGDGTYRLAVAEEQNITTTLQVGKNGDAMGKLTVLGLSEGTYYLTETKAPGGYNKPNSPVKIEIKDADNNGKPTSKDDAGNDTTEYGDGFVARDVINTQGFELPTTGGMGTFLFTVGGVAIMGAAILLFFVLRRRQEVSDR